MKNRKKNKGIGTLQALAFVIRDLLSRNKRSSTAIIILLMVISGAFLSLMCYYGGCIYSERKDDLKDSNPLLIECTIPPGLGDSDSTNFTEAKKQSILNIDGVSHVFDSITMSAELRVEGFKPVHTYHLISGSPNEPGLSKERLLWGEGFSGPDGNEIILTDSQMAKVAKSPFERPSTVSVSLVRDRNGKVTSYVEDFKVVGVVSDRTDSAYIPIEKIRRIDLWQRGVVNDVSTESDGYKLRTAYPSLTAITKGSANVEAIKKDTQEMKIGISDPIPFSRFVIEGYPWMSVTRPDHKALTKDEEATVTGIVRDNSLAGDILTRRYGIVTMDATIDVAKKGVRFLAIDPDDENYADVFTQGERNALKTLGIALSSHSDWVGLSIKRNTSGIYMKPIIASSVRPCPEFHGCDVICSKSTMKRFLGSFNLGDETLCYVRNKWVAEMLSRSGPVMEHGSSDFLTESGICVSKEKPILEISEVPKEESAKTAFSGHFRITDNRIIKATILPDPDFDKLIQAKRKPKKGERRCIVVLRHFQSIGDMLDDKDVMEWKKKNILSIYGFVESDESGFILPQSSVSNDAGFEPTFAGNVTGAPVDKFGNVVSIVGSDCFYSGSRLMLFRCPKATFLKKFRTKFKYPGALDYVTLVGIKTVPDVRLDNQGFSRRVRLAYFDDPSDIKDIQRGWVNTYTSMGNSTVILNSTSTNHPGKDRLNGVDVAVKEARNGTMPYGYVFAKREFVLDNAGMFLPQSAFSDIRLPETLEVMLTGDAKMQKIAKGLEGYRVEPCSLKEIKYMAFTLTDEKAEKGVSEDLLPFLRAEGTYLQVTPDIFLEAKLGDKEIVLKGSHRDDLIRHSLEGLEGSWIEDDDGFSVIMPSEILSSPIKAPEEYIGETIRMRFAKKNELSRNNQELDIGFKVKGVYKGSGMAYIQLKAADNVELWAQDRIDYNNRRDEFMTYEDEIIAAGTTSVKVYVSELKDVVTVSSILSKRMGYHVNSAVNFIVSVEKMRGSLITLISLVIAGPLVMLMIIITFITWMSTSSRLYEIGIIRVNGGTKRDVYKIFLVHAILLGIFAFLAAFMISTSCEPGVRSFMKFLNMSPVNDPSSSMTSPEFWWIHGLLLVVCMAFSLTGVMLSAWRACRMPIRDLIGHNK